MFLIVYFWPHLDSKAGSIGVSETRWLGPLVLPPLFGVKDRYPVTSLWSWAPWRQSWDSALVCCDSEVSDMSQVGTIMGLRD